MKAIITDEVLQRFTWKGTSQKSSFIQFKEINELLISSIRSDENSYTEFDHNVSMKEYCKHASTRLKSKMNNKTRSDTTGNDSEGEETNEEDDHEDGDDSDENNENECEI